MLRWLSSCFIMLFCVTLSAQSENELLEQAETAFAERQFKAAAKAYNQYLSISRDPRKVYFDAAIANYESGAFDKAERYLLYMQANELDGAGKIQFYLGLVDHAQSQYEQAIQHFKNALKQGLDTQLDRCKKLILQSRYAMKLNQLSSYAFVENLGSTINTSYDEIGPIPSPNFEGRIYFSSNRAASKGGKRDANGLPDEEGTYAFDIYKADQENGVWTAPRPFNDLLNSPRNEILNDFTSEGKVAFFVRGLNTSYGEILTDTFRQGQPPPINSPKFIAPPDAAFGDKDLYFVNDSTLIFASVRDEGYGGYDLYITFSKGGIWTPPKNLGESINSPFHDRSPFVDQEGNLFFSSDRLEGFGGFDIYSAAWTPLGWQEVVNMRSGINSSDDELFFRRRNDDYSAYFASARKQGMGKFDIYSAYFKEPFGKSDLDYSKELATVYISQVATRNPSNAPSISEKKWVIRPVFFQENQETLTSDQKVILDEMVLRLKSYPDLKANLLCHSDYTGPKKYDLYFSYKMGELCMQYLIEKGVAAEQLNILGCGSAYPIYIDRGRPGVSSEMNVNRRLSFLLSGSGPESWEYDHAVPVEQLEGSPFQQLWDLLEGVSFSVQIAATEQLYEGSALNAYSNPLLHRPAEKPILKYTLGIFERYEEARNLRYRLIKDGYQGAFITAYIDGIRRTRGELRAMITQYPDLEAYINVE